MRAKEVARSTRAQAVRIRNDPHTRKVEPICVPARLHADVCIDQAVAVVPTRVGKEILLFAGDSQCLGADLTDELRAAFAVPAIGPLISTTGIVQQGEKLDDAHTRVGASGDRQAVKTDPCPMAGAVRTMPVDVHELPPDDGDDFPW